MIVVVDNYDSFTYNLVQYLGELGAEVAVYRNDSISADNLIALQPTHIIISPGPGVPRQAGITCELIKKCGSKIPLLGVCLGHQAIGEVFGGVVKRARVLMHGKVSTICHEGKGLYQGIKAPFKAARYHSLIVERESLPACLKITAQTEDGVIMGLRHTIYPLEGVQFHPESIMTEHGKLILNNFLKRSV